jgi:hypothetical protein
MELLFVVLDILVCAKTKGRGAGRLAGNRASDKPVSTVLNFEFEIFCKF